MNAAIGKGLKNTVEPHVARIEVSQCILFSGINSIKYNETLQFFCLERKLQLQTIQKLV